jgi:hypothetical protein
VPLAARGPLQPPVAVHVVAFVELQVRVVCPPLLTAEFDALIVAVGTGLDPDDPPPPPQATNICTAVSPAKTVKNRINYPPSIFSYRRAVAVPTLANFLGAFGYVNLCP